MTDTNEKGRIQRKPWFPLTITPISKNPKSASNIDYHEQVARVGHRWCWDDSRYNTANVGEYFAYYFHGIKVVVHKILEVKSPTERLPSWSRNVGQGNRNVLELSDPLCVIPWSTWQEMKGPENKMGTYRTDLSDKRPLLLEYFRRNIFITG
jgi:hypothetical protein